MGVLNLQRRLTEEQFGSLCREFQYNNGDYDKIRIGNIIYMESFPGCSERNYLLIKNNGRTIIFPNTKTLDKIINSINGRLSEDNTR